MTNIKIDIQDVGTNTQLTVVLLSESGRMDLGTWVLRPVQAEAFVSAILDPETVWEFGRISTPPRPPVLDNDPRIKPKPITKPDLLGLGKRL